MSSKLFNIKYLIDIKPIIEIAALTSLANLEYQSYTSLSLSQALLTLDQILITLLMPERVGNQPASSCVAKSSRAFSSLVKNFSLPFCRTLLRFSAIKVSAVKIQSSALKCRVDRVPFKRPTHKHILSSLCIKIRLQLIKRLMGIALCHLLCARSTAESIRFV